MIVINRRCHLSSSVYWRRTCMNYEGRSPFSYESFAGPRKNDTFSGWFSPVDVNALRSLHFTARRYASEVYTAWPCLSVCPSVCHNSRVLPKRLNLGSRTQRHSISQDSSFWRQRSCWNSNGVTPTWALDIGGVG